MTVDACRVCGNECSYCANKRRAAKVQAEFEALREMNRLEFAQAMAMRERPILARDIDTEPAK